MPTNVSAIRAKANGSPLCPQTTEAGNRLGIIIILIAIIIAIIVTINIAITIIIIILIIILLIIIIILALSPVLRYKKDSVGECEAERQTTE